jgi:hypothetical protein
MADRYVGDVQNHITGTSKCNFKHFYFEIYLNGNFLILTFAYTTSDVYLTLKFKFWNLCIKSS